MAAGEKLVKQRSPRLYSNSSRLQVGFFVEINAILRVLIVAIVPARQHIATR